MKKHYSLTVRGENKVWIFDILAEPPHVEEWRDDGLDVGEVCNTIPEWYVNAGLPVGLYCFFQDFFNLRKW